MGGFFLKRGGVERNRKARGGRGKGGGGGEGEWEEGAVR